MQGEGGGQRLSKLALEGKEGDQQGREGAGGEDGMGQRHRGLATGQLHFGGQLTAGKVVGLGNGAVGDRLPAVREGGLGQKQTGQAVHAVLGSQGGKACHHPFAVPEGVAVEPQAEKAVGNVGGGRKLRPLGHGMLFHKVPPR